MSPSLNPTSSATLPGSIRVITTPCTSFPVRSSRRSWLLSGAKCIPRASARADASSSCWPVAEATCSLLGNSTRQIAKVADFVAVERQYDVSLFQAGFCSRAVRGHDGDQCSMLPLQSKARSDGRGHLLDLHAEPAAAHLPVLFELCDHRLGKVRRHREANADAAAIG